MEPYAKMSKMSKMERTAKPESSGEIKKKSKHRYVANEETESSTGERDRSTIMESTSQKKKFKREDTPELAIIAKPESTSQRQRSPKRKSTNPTVSLDSLSEKDKKKLNPKEIYDICRSEIKKNPKDFLKRNPAKLDIIIAHNIGIRLRIQTGKKEKIEANQEYLSFYYFSESDENRPRYRGTSTRPLAFDDNFSAKIGEANDKMYIFSEDNINGFKVIVEHFQNMFLKKIDVLEVNGDLRDEYWEGLKGVVKWVNATKQEIRKCEIGRHSPLLSTDMEFILEHLDCAFDIWSQRQYELSFFKTPELTVFYGHWFTYENLLVADCGYIYLYETTFTNENMRDFMKEWMDGMFPNLKEADVHLAEDVDVSVILTGLPGYDEKTNTTDGSTVVFKKNGICIRSPNGQHVAEINTEELPSKAFDIVVQSSATYSLLYPSVLKT